MIHVYFIRHGKTQWNSEKRLQGRTDIPLNEVGKHQISTYQLPSNLQSIKWFHSPLSRTRQTADLLDIDSHAEDSLIEMNWGAWEGKTLEELSNQDPLDFAKQEARGLDLQPQGGESPRLVAERVSVWAQSLDINGVEQHIGCVSHKGIIRAIYALATNWNMLGKPRDKLDFHCAQYFCFEDGRWSIGELNIRLQNP